MFSDSSQELAAGFAAASFAPATQRPVAGDRRLFMGDADGKIHAHRRSFPFGPRRTLAKGLPLPQE